MIVIAGLGNPGEEYTNTRHNAGRIFVEWFRKENDLPEWVFDKKSSALISQGKVGKEKVLLLMPETFMNKSGASVQKYVKSVKAAESLVVIHDELDLPIGRVKMSFNKSSGGHRGVESVKKAVKTEAFVRVRVGISGATASGKLKKPSGEKEVNNFILGKFKPDQLTQLKKVSKKVNESLRLLITENREVATGLCNQN